MQTRIQGAQVVLSYLSTRSILSRRNETSKNLGLNLGLGSAQYPSSVFFDAPRSAWTFIGSQTRGAGHEHGHEDEHGHTKMTDKDRVWAASESRTPRDNPHATITASGPPPNSGTPAAGNVRAVLVVLYPAMRIPFRS